MSTHVKQLLQHEISMLLHIFQNYRDHQYEFEHSHTMYLEKKKDKQIFNSFQIELKYLTKDNKYFYFKLK